MLLTLKKLCFQQVNTGFCLSRFVRHFSERKKFFQEARIFQSDGGFKISLDERKLRSPLGKVVNIPSEGLAHAVTVEWNQQKENIKTQLMPLTALCYEAMDCSSNRNPDVLAAATLKFLYTDTVLFYMDEQPDLMKLQQRRWGELISKFNQFHGVNIEHTMGFGKPTVNEKDVQTLVNYLKSFNTWSLIGIERLVNVLKSVIIPLTLINRQITVEEAVSLSRLEQEFQISKWGNIEWHHDMELLELRMKTAACSLFIQLCSEESSVCQLERKAKPS